MYNVRSDDDDPNTRPDVGRADLASGGFDERLTYFERVSVRLARKGTLCTETGTKNPRGVGW